MTPTETNACAAMICGEDYTIDIAGNVIVDGDVFDLRSSADAREHTMIALSEHRGVRIDSAFDLYRGRSEWFWFNGLTKASETGFSCYEDALIAAVRYE